MRVCAEKRSETAIHILGGSLYDDISFHLLITPGVIDSKELLVTVFSVLEK